MSSATLAPLADAMDRRQPRALWTLFRSEMWERFSFYGMRALLVLYLTKKAGYSRSDALEVYAVYGGLVYLLPIVGGYLADRLLGFRKAILVGGIVMMSGHAAMAVPSLLYPALGLLVIGNGFFKPNVTSLLGQQYRDDDPRRDAGFTYFYVGINVGASLAFVAGWLGERVGWQWGFASAAVGMAFGLVQFTIGQGRLGTTGMPPGRTGAVRLLPSDWIHVVLLSLGAILLVYAVISVRGLIGSVWALVPWQAKAALPFAVLGWILLSSQRTGGRHDLERVASIIVLGLFNVFFWMGFEQAGGTMNLFADQSTDRALYGWQIPATFFQSIEPVAIVLFGPVVSAFWTWTDRRGGALTSPAKMAIGMIVLGLGFVVLAIAQQRADHLGPVSPLWLTAVYLLHTIGELCCSPVGLSMVTKVSPSRMVGLMMGLWFCSLSAGSYLAGTLESLLIDLHIPLYAFLVGTSIGAGVLLLAVAPLLRGWMLGRA